MWKRLSSLIGLVLFGLATWVIYREVKHIGWPALRRDFLATPPLVLISAIALTALAYALLSTYDVLAFHYIQRKLKRRFVMLAAFIGYAFSNSISMTPSMAARYRLYTHWGLTKQEITKVFFFHYLSTWLGFFVVGGALLMIEPAPIATSSYLTFNERRWIGALLFGLLLAYFIAGRRFKQGITIKGISFRLPAMRLIVMQVTVATLDWVLVGVIPYLLLQGWRYLSYPSFLGIFMLAQILQIVSHVPGGIGIFEGTILLSLKGTIPSSVILASLLVYRVVYTVLPLVVAAPALLVTEIKLKKLAAPGSGSES